MNISFLSLSDLENPEIFLKLKCLLTQLSDDEVKIERFSENRLRRMLSRETTYIACAKNNAGEIIGLGVLNILEDCLEGFGYVGSIIVDKKQRKCGAGTALNQALLKKAEEWLATYGLDFVALTSHPSKVEANKLYQKLGFEKPETNYYRLYLS